MHNNCARLFYIFLTFSKICIISKICVSYSNSVQSIVSIVLFRQNSIVPSSSSVNIIHPSITVAVGVMRSLRLTTHHGRRYTNLLIGDAPTAPIPEKCTVPSQMKKFPFMSVKALLPYSAIIASLSAISA